MAIIGHSVLDIIKFVHVSVVVLPDNVDRANTPAGAVLVGFKMFEQVMMEFFVLVSEVTGQFVTVLVAPVVIVQVVEPVPPLASKLNKQSNLQCANSHTRSTADYVPLRVSRPGSG